MHDVPLPFDSPSLSSRQKGGQVPRTSVLAYQATDANSRIQMVLTELGSYSIEYCHSPTSAELTRWANRLSPMELLLEIRRGLSDAKRKGLVTNGDKRICRVAHTLALTWKVASR